MEEVTRTDTVLKKSPELRAVPFYAMHTTDGRIFNRPHIESVEFIMDY